MANTANQSTQPTLPALPSPLPVAPYIEEEGRIRLPLSRATAASCGAEPQQCWRNSLLAGAQLSRNFSELTYHEGIVLAAFRGGLVLPIEHGWLEYQAQGRSYVLDVTLPLVTPDEALLLSGRYLTTFAWRVEEIEAYVTQVGSVTLPLSGMGGVLLEPLLGAQSHARIAATWRRALELASAQPGA